MIGYDFVRSGMFSLSSIVLDRNPDSVSNVILIISTIIAIIASLKFSPEYGLVAGVMAFSMSYVIILLLISYVLRMEK